MHRPVLAPIVVSPLRVPVDRAGDGVKQEASSFLLLDSPMSLCQSPFSTAESRRTSQTSYDDLLQDLQEDTEQWASYGLHMEHSQTPSEEGLVNSDWIDGGEGDSPTTGDFAAASASGSQRGSRSSRAVPRFSPVSSQGSSWSSSRRPGAPSVVLSFQTNSQFQLSAPPSRRSHNSRGSSSSLGSNFSFSAANQIALANRAARPSVAASSSFGGYTASNASTHRHSVGSATGPDAKASDAEEEHNLTPAQAFIRNIRKREEARASNPTCWRWEEAIAAEHADNAQETLEGDADKARTSSTTTPKEDDEEMNRTQGGSRFRSTLGKLGLRRRTRSNASQSSSSLRSELGRGFIA